MPSRPAPAAVFHYLLTVCGVATPAYAADTSSGAPLTTIRVESRADDVGRLALRF
jgi:hypothetical protein